MIGWWCEIKYSLSFGEDNLSSGFNKMIGPSPIPFLAGDKFQISSNNQIVHNRFWFRNDNNCH